MTQSSELKNADPPSLATARLFGAPPVMGGESVRSYDELLARICATLKPTDSLEEIWILDVVNLVWDAFRLRRLKAGLMTNSAETAVKLELDRTYPHAGQIVTAWAAGDEDAASQVHRALASQGLSVDRTIARWMISSFKHLEQIDRMLVSVEMRRSVALRELDRHRAPLAQKLRRAIAEAEEAELVSDAPRLAAPQPA
jgi:hypothetical protein